MSTTLMDYGVVFPDGTLQDNAPTSGSNFIRFPSNLIINFGYVKVTGGSLAVTFAQPFSVAAYTIVLSVNAAAGNDTGGFASCPAVRSGSLTTTGAVFSTASVTTDYISYVAIGK